MNAGSELILRQLFDRFGRRVLLPVPTYALFPEIAGDMIQVPLDPEEDFRLDPARLVIPEGSTLDG